MSVHDDLAQAFAELKVANRQVERSAFEQGYLVGVLACLDGDIHRGMDRDDLLAAAAGAGSEYAAKYHNTTESEAA